MGDTSQMPRLEVGLFIGNLLMIMVYKQEKAMIEEKEDVEISKGII